ncbi:response regulator [Fusibacter bizertensis]|uniref:Stage 0 sporulation protein A homolog n=1 Tax=Fusibacter bizertensis TaxID=1488331 RepID=A0ABT6NA22_9FIRM|nr:response regulator [Fusibacter bizertensis]MDH8677262.1 response regulator [Fusibacter bizertensis]
MLRVLIVDDEAIVLESVTQVLSSQFKNIAIETAKNSREGLIKVEHFRPNVIMTDIKMPGMNGLEFIERIRKVNQMVKIIIVSAYDHFEYAKEAVKFDVEDYILKPLSKSKLIEVISSIETKVELEEELRNKELDNIEKYYQSIQLVESNFFNSILLNRNILKYMAHYRELLEVPFLKGGLITIEFDKLPLDTDSGDLSNYNQKLYDCADYLKTHIKYHKSAIVSNPFLNRIFVYVEEDNDINFWNNLAQLIMERFKLRVRIGIGTEKPVEQLRDSYTESLLAMRVSDKSVSDMHDLKETEATYDTFEKIKNQLFNDFVNRNKSFKTTLKYFEGEYIQMLNHKRTTEYAEAILIELLVLVYNRSHRMTNKTKEEEISHHYLVEIAGRSPMAKLQYFEKKVSEWFSAYAKMQSESFNVITLSAIDALKSDYKGEITLEDLALRLNVTPQYLSKVFKDDTGVTFKEYLTELRIETSKEMLRSGEYSIKDICFKVGYNDTSYFIRAFKKFEGLTPKDYQKIYR